MTLEVKEEYLITSNDQKLNGKDYCWFNIVIYLCIVFFNVIFKKYIPSCFLFI